MEEDQSIQMSFPPSNADFVLDPKAASDCTYEEFENSNTSDARGMILEIYLQGMALAESMVKGDEERREFRTAIDQMYNLMIVREASRDDGLVDPETLLLVTSREVLAGRMMESDELRILALKGPEEDQIASDRQRPSPPKETSADYLVFAIKLVGTFVGLCLILYLLSEHGPSF